MRKPKNVVPSRAVHRAVVRDPYRRDLVAGIVNRVNGAAVGSLAYAYDAFGRTIAQSGPLADVFRHRFSAQSVQRGMGTVPHGGLFHGFSGETPKPRPADRDRQGGFARVCWEKPRRLPVRQMSDGLLITVSCMVW